MIRGHTLFLTRRVRLLPRSLPCHYRGSLVSSLSLDPNNVNERVGEVLAFFQILQDRVYRSRKTLGSLTEEEHGGPADPRHIPFAAHWPRLHEFAAHAKLHHDVPQEP